jgi:hypothetical protein
LRKELSEEKEKGKEKRKERRFTLDGQKQCFGLHLSSYITCILILALTGITKLIVYISGNINQFI